jgi:hypothetical protein
MKKFLALFALTLALPASASAIEVQAWKTPMSHIHTLDCMQQFQTLSAPVSCPVTTLLHNSDETLSFVRWSDYSTVEQSISMNWTPGPVGEATRTDTFMLDPAKFAASGWRELRWTSNATSPTRAFTTTRECLWVVNGKPRSDDCGGPATAGRCGGGSWYPDPPGNYLVSFVDCRDVNKAQTQPFHAGDVIRVKFQGTGNHGEANIDPHFHMGDAGVVLPDMIGGDRWTTLRIPAGLAPGPHKLVLRDVWTNGNEGVYVQPFTAA